MCVTLLWIFCCVACTYVHVCRHATTRMHIIKDCSSFATNVQDKQQMNRVVGTYEYVLQLSGKLANGLLTFDD